MNFFFCGIGLLLTAVIIHCEGACTDSPGFTLYANGVWYNCSGIAANVPQYCHSVITSSSGVVYNISQTCCSSCGSVVIPTCVDSLYFALTIVTTGQNYTCPQIASQIPQYCNYNVTLNGQTRLVRYYCCASCASAVIPTCVDSIGFSLTLLPSGQTYNCSQIALQIPQYCNNNVTLDGEKQLVKNICCSSCSKAVIPTCLDSVGFILTIPGSGNYTCLQIASQIPQYCNINVTLNGQIQLIRNICCASCTTAVIPTCLNSPGFTLTINSVSYNCAQIASQLPFYCNTNVAVNGMLVKNVCCSSCQAAAPCQNDSNFTINIGTASNPNIRTCAQLTTNTQKTKLCCQNRSGTSNGVTKLGVSGCCATCLAYTCP